MKKLLKKMSALLVAMAMVMAMCMTVSADTTINLTGADSATKYMMQVIAANPTTPTGWEFVNGAAGAYRTAFDTSDDQAIIVALIKNVNASATVPTAYASVAAATTEQLDRALSGLTINGTYQSSVSAPGLYAIKATETGFTYKNMAAYVEFGATTTSEIVAKKSPIAIQKTTTGSGDTDSAVAIGDTVSYKVTSNIPYIDSLNNKKTYKIIDTINGADYNVDSVAVTVGGVPVTLSSAEKTIVTNPNGTQTLTVDLSGQITVDNANANKPVVLTYTAVVTKTTVENTVSHEATDVSDSDTVNVYTGQIRFNVKAVSADGAVSDPLAFRHATAGVDGVYIYDPNGRDTVTEVKTGTNGTVVVKGLDEGTYEFYEITAPNGYSINENPTSVQLSATKDATTGRATAEFSNNDAEMTDSLLSALPSTGGIGTYVFTIVGVVLMAAAAGILFIKRRRSAE